VDTFISADELRKFESAIEAACDATGYSWKSLDDDIDAVTLCMASPNSAQVEPKVVLATTDCIGRINPNPAESVGKQIQEMDRKKREDMLHQIQRIMADRVVFAGIWENGFIRAFGPRMDEAGLNLIPSFPYAGPLEELRLKKQ